LPEVILGHYLIGIWCY